LRTITPPATATRTGALLITVFVLQFLVALDMSLVNIALPAIRSDLGFTAAGLSWVVNAYLLCFAGFMLVGGRVGDVWGRRPVILVGLTIFACASVIGGLATAPGLLVGARAAQGLGAALLAPASLALVATIDDTDRRRKAMGLWGGAGAVGGAVGVVASGVFTDWWNWRAVMFVNVPIVVIALIATVHGVGRGGPSGARSRLDVTGGILVTGGVAALVYAVSATGDHGWLSARTVIGAAAAIVLLAAFAVVERTGSHPLMPIRVLATRSILGANIFGFMLAAGQLAAFYFCSLYIQTVWEVSADLTGILFLPFCAFVGVGIVVSSKLSARFGVRNAITVLGLLGAAGLAVFARMPEEFDFWTGILLPSLLAATGIGGSMVLVGAAGTAGVAADDVGVASGVLNSSRQLGGTIGLAALVTIATHQTVARDGYQVGLAVGAVFLVVASAAAWLILPRDRRPANG
jgi:EmrB/QacA subfamily drug resistance transporter